MFLKTKIVDNLTLIFGVFLIIFLIAYNPSFLARSSNEAYATNKDEIQETIAKIDAETAKLNSNLEDASSLKSTLQEQQKSVQVEIDSTEAIILESKLLINTLQTQIDQKQSEYDSLVGEMKTLLFEIEKESRVPLFLRLISSDNLVDALSKSYSYVLLQSKADNLRVELENTRKELEASKSVQEARKAQLEQTSYLLKSKKSGLDDLLNTYRNKENEYSALVKSLNEEKQSQEAQVYAIDRQNITTQSNGANVAGGTSCWFEEPVPLDIPKDYFARPADGSISRIFDGCAHDAADIANSIGTPLHAVADGIVYKKGYASGGYGNYIFIKHTLPSGQRVYALYGHMNSQSFLSTGDYVSKGTVIGYMGSTGYSTGPHVHFALFSESFEQNGGNEGCRNGGKTHSFCFNPGKYITL